jgi:hypothetical protein
VGFPVIKERQRCPLYELADDVLLVRFQAEVVNRNNIRVIECGYGARFALETTATLGAVGITQAENLDGDVTVQPRIEGAINLAHAACTERGPDLIRA